MGELGGVQGRWWLVTLQVTVGDPDVLALRAVLPLLSSLVQLEHPADMAVTQSGCVPGSATRPFLLLHPRRGARRVECGAERGWDRYTPVRWDFQILFWLCRFGDKAKKTTTQAVTPL